MSRATANHVGLLAALLLMPVGFLLLGLTGGLAFPLGLAGIAVAQFAGLALPAWLAARAAGPPRQVLGLVRPPARALAGAALIAVSYWYLAALLLLPLVSDLVTKREKDLLEQQFIGADPLALKIVVLALVPAVCEELLVRGAIARGLRPRAGAVAAAIISSAYFALLHFSIARLPITFLFGMVLAVAVFRSGSLLPAMLIHAGNNTAAILISQPGMAGAKEFLGEWSAFLLPVAGLATGIGLVAVWQSARNAPT